MDIRWPSKDNTFINKSLRVGFWCFKESIGIKFTAQHVNGIKIGIVHSRWSSNATIESFTDLVCRTLYRFNWLRIRYTVIQSNWQYKLLFMPIYTKEHGLAVHHKTLWYIEWLLVGNLWAILALEILYRIFNSLYGPSQSHSFSFRCLAHL